MLRTVLEKKGSLQIQLLRRHWAWIFVGLAVLFAAGVRLRLRELPLERDEGEYAYAGQLILQGVAPYKEVYNMKLPGTYAAYAVIMAIFGQTPSGIHLGVTLVNAASIVLIYLIGRKLLDDVAGVTAAIFYALLSCSQSVLGLAGHATHFVVLPALAGILVLMRACATRKRHFYLLSGLLFGLAFLMKQHGIFFGIFGGIVVICTRLTEPFDDANAEKTLRASKRVRWGQKRKRPWVKWGSLCSEAGIFFAGFAFPYLITCLCLFAAGAFHQFLFWTVSYARSYASGSSVFLGSEFLRRKLLEVAGPNFMLWILPWIGAILIWWESRLRINERILLTAMLICSLGSVLIGLYLRPHYFVTLLPIAALLTGVSVSRSLHLMRHEQSFELFLAFPILALFAFGCLSTLIGNGPPWFEFSQQEAIQNSYGSTLFLEAPKIAEAIRANTPPQARIAVIGSEPEIYFYSHRRSATGYIYMYPLMEAHSYALNMQKELIAEIERNPPQYVVHVEDKSSWLGEPGSHTAIIDWWDSYRATRLELVEIRNIEQPNEATATASPSEAELARPKMPPRVLTYKQRH